MNRHPFRWEALAFGLLFLAVAGTWTAWKTDVLASNHLAYAPAATLIVLGVAGIIASFSTSGRRQPDGPEGADDTDETDETDETREEGPDGGEEAGTQS